jgi:glucans biosynthesis protein
VDERRADQSRRQCSREHRPAGEGVPSPGLAPAPDLPSSAKAECPSRRSAGNPQTSRRCTATCADGSPCRAWAVHGTDPPRCAPHGGSKARVGAPKGNQNARTHGFYVDTDVPEAGWSIETVIADLSAKQARLSRYIDQLYEDDDADVMEFSRLLRLHGMNASRLGRLLKDQRALRGDTNDRLEQVLEQALDELSAEWGVDL